jgi:hypothetical protein
MPVAHRPDMAHAVTTHCIYAGSSWQAFVSVSPIHGSCIQTVVRPQTYAHHHLVPCACRAGQVHMAACTGCTKLLRLVYADLYMSCRSLRWASSARHAHRHHLVHHHQSQSTQAPAQAPSWALSLAWLLPCCCWALRQTTTGAICTPTSGPSLARRPSTASGSSPLLVQLHPPGGQQYMALARVQHQACCPLSL